MEREFYGEYDKAYIFYMKNGDEIRLVGSKVIPSDINFLFIEVKLTETHYLDIKKDEVLFMEGMTFNDYVDKYEKSISLDSLAELGKF